jgi:glyoxylase I family protein
MAFTNMTAQQFYLHHTSLLVSNTQHSLEFYCGVLGLEKIPRPELPFPGAWLFVSEHQQIHLLELPSQDSSSGRPEHGGRDRHFALIVPDLDAMRVKIEQANINYTTSKSGRRALFCRDPDSNAVELIEIGVLPGTETLFD